jgi:hypothetical protein
MSDSEKHVYKLKDQGFPPGRCHVKTDDKHDLACRDALKTWYMFTGGF